jgi:excisionase family DNA binding protein
MSYIGFFIFLAIYLCRCYNVINRIFAKVHFSNIKKVSEMEKEILNELQEIKQLTVLGAKKALTLKDATLLTGLSASNIYKKTRDREIPHYKSQGGKLLYFDKEELTSWMLKNRIKTAEELETEAANYLVQSKMKKGGRK